MKLKLFLFTLLFFILFLVFPKNSFAQAPENNRNSEYFNTNPDVPINHNTYIQSVFINVASTISCALTGLDPVNPDKPCLGIDPVTKKIGYVEDNGGGLIGMTGGLIAFTFNIPVNSHDYGSYMAGNFGVAKSAYAQGVGFQSLTPTLKLWEAFRNITYMLFVVLFVVVGLGIMFRIPIDARSVMTIQNQIPKIIIGLILVTFSYAIAGFLIDMMYVSMYIVISVFAQQGFSPVDISAGSPFGAIGGFGGITGIAHGVSGSISGVVASIFDGTLGTMIGAIIGALIGKMLGGVVGGFFGPVGNIVSNVVGVAGGALVGGLFGNKIIGYLAGIITYLIVVIALFSALLRLWIILIKSYIYILIAVVFAPFYIAKGLIPGQVGFGGWIRSIVSNLAVFPVTVIMFLLGKAFIQGFSQGDPGDIVFAPPLTGDFSSPETFGAVIGLAIVLMTPEVANMTKEALKASEFKYSGAAAKGIGVGASMLTSPVKGVTGKYFGTNPLTGDPKYFNKAIMNRFGRGSSIVSKAVRGLTGTGKHYEQNYGERQRMNEFNTGRRRTRPSGPEFGQVHGPELPKPASLAQRLVRKVLGGTGAGGTGAGGTGAGGTGAGGTGAGGTGAGGTGAGRPIPHSETVEERGEEDHEEEHAEERREEHRGGGGGGGGDSRDHDDRDTRTLEELVREVSRLRGEHGREGRDHSAAIEDLERKIERLNNP